MRPLARTAGLAVTLACGTAAALISPATADSQAPDVVAVEFTAPGSTTWVVPDFVCEVTVTAAGARGGTGYVQAVNGGTGAVVQAPLTVLPGEPLVVSVGGAGPDGTRAPGGVPGGANGGGHGGAGYQSGGGAGGGASDLRRGPELRGRLLVAGGGGGGAGGMTLGGHGGDGGAVGGSGQSSGIGYGGGGGGTGSAGGTGGLDDDRVLRATAGGAGAGGTGSDGRPPVDPSGNAYGGGGGGGGLFGGGGGGAIYPSVELASASGGGGGSSLVPPDGVITDGANDGDGRVEIAWNPGAQPTGCGAAPQPAPADPGSPGGGAAPPRAPAAAAVPGTPHSTG